MTEIEKAGEPFDCQPSLTFLTDQWTVAVIGCAHGKASGEGLTRASYREAAMAAAQEWRASHHGRAPADAPAGELDTVSAEAIGG
jgi:hypothetical protein